jgi:hypothetical protein
MHRRNRKPTSWANFLRRSRECAQQFAVLRLVDQRESGDSRLPARARRAAPRRPSSPPAFSGGAPWRQRQPEPGLSLRRSFALRRSMLQASAPSPPASSRKTKFGIPGISPEHADDGRRQASTFGLLNSWPMNCCADVLSSSPTRVTTMPAAIEMISAGNLRHQAVADGQQGVGLGRVAGRPCRAASRRRTGRR